VHQVRVKIVGGRPRAINLTLVGGGGLEAYIRKDTQSCDESRDRMLVLSNMDLSIVSLQLLMEAALAGLQDAMIPDALPDATVSDNDASALAESSANIRTGLDDALNTSKQLVKSLETSALSIQRLTASKTIIDGEWSLDLKDVVQSIELNHNPEIGKGRKESMKLIVQLSCLTAGQYLMCLHLDNNNIEDEGMAVLTRAFLAGFAPRIAILWLNENCVTDVGAAIFGGALETSLDSLAEIYLFRYCSCPVFLLQRIATPCNTLQHTATHCNIPVYLGFSTMPRILVQLVTHAYNILTALLYPGTNSRCKERRYCGKNPPASR